MPKALAVKDLSAWLSYIESLHPKSIAMGLERIKLISSRLNLEPGFSIITVAGTNGKGSTCAMLEHIYRQAGYQVGCYTSPHLLRYNERVRVNGHEVNDTDLCQAFAAVDAARMGEDGKAVALTYFEVGTLAAVWHFMQTKIDVAILEIGLGGRLDAVNAFEPDCAIVTSVDLDHLEFLGDTREKIGSEKAGVYRKTAPAICGDNNPPASLVSHARKIQADLQCIHQDFDYSVLEHAWQYQAHGKVLHTLPMPALKGDYQLHNAACAIAAVESLQSSLPVSSQAIAAAMRQVTLAGRFQTISTSPRVILDVAHNPHAARALAENLRASASLAANTIAVFAMLADKDIKGVVEAVKEQIDIWYIASIENVRGASATDLAVVIAAVNPAAKYKIFDNAAIAYQQACIDAGENDKIIVFGSFFTVSNVMQALSNHAKN